MAKFPGTDKTNLSWFDCFLLAVVLIFGIAVSNAGTAMRHRNKIMPLLLVYYAMLNDCEQ